MFFFGNWKHLKICGACSKPVKHEYIVFRKLITNSLIVYKSFKICKDLQYSVNSILKLGCLILATVPAVSFH